MEVATADRVKPRRLPGVDGVWVFIGADSVIFAILFLSFMQDRLKNPAIFEASRQTLNMNLGGIDTIILLTSSWSVAQVAHDRINQRLALHHVPVRHRPDHRDDPCDKRQVVAAYLAAESPDGERAKARHAEDQLDVDRGRDRRARIDCEHR